MVHRLKWWALGLVVLAAIILLMGRADTPRAVAAPSSAKTDQCGDSLPSGAVVRLGTIRFRHGDRVVCVSVSPDGKLLATAGSDGNVRLWEVASGREVGVLTKDDTRLHCVVFSPDGKTLAVGDEQRVRLWDVTARRVLWEQKQERGQNDLIFAPDGKSLIATGPGGGVRRWDTTTGKPLQADDRPALHNLYGTVPLRDGKAVITAIFVCRPTKEGGGGIQSVLEVRDVATGKVLRRIGEASVPAYKVYDTSHVHGQLIALSPDDTTLAVVCEYRRRYGVSLYDVATGKEQLRLNTEDLLSCVACAPDGRTIVAGSEEGQLYIWEAKTAQGERVARPPLHTIPAHASAIRTMIFLPGGKELATADEEGVIRLWDPATGKEVRPREGSGSPISALAVSADGKTIFTGSQETFVRRWDSATGKELGRFEGLARGASGIACPADGKTLAAAADKHEIALWDVASGKEMGRWKTRDDHSAAQVAFAPDGKTLASAGTDGRVWLWDPATGKEVRRMKSNNLIITHDPRLTFSADGKLIASSNHQVGVRVWDAATGQARLAIKLGKPDAEALAFAPNGTMLAVACDDGEVRVYGTAADKTIEAPDDLRIEGDNSGIVEVATAKKLHQMGGSGHRVCAVAFSPDGRLLAFGGDDGIVHLWDTATWREKTALRGHKGDVTALAFLSNERLASAGADTTVLVWDVTR